MPTAGTVQDQDTGQDMEEGAVGGEGPYRHHAVALRLS